MSISSPGSKWFDKQIAGATSHEHTPLRVSLPVPMSDEDLDLDAGGCAPTFVDLPVEEYGPTIKDLDVELEGVAIPLFFFQGCWRLICAVQSF